MNYYTWLGVVYDTVEEMGELTRSDAQGVVDAQEHKLAQCWGNGLNAIDTAKIILGKS